MDAQEFKKDFMEDVKAEAAITGEGTCASFVEAMGNYLIEAEVLPDFSYSYYTGTAGRRSYRVDGYAFDELDGTMNLIIADYKPEDSRSLTRTIAERDFGKLVTFVDQALNSRLYKDIEMSIPCADLIDLLRANKSFIKKYRLLIFTTAAMSQTIITLDQYKIEGVDAECQIWDIDRLYRVCSSASGREDIVIDFSDYTSDGIPVLQATDVDNGDGYDSYLGIIPGAVLADLYDKYGGRLLEGNVRSFLSTRGKVNKKIRETILKNPDMFFAYNNGVAVTAKDIEVQSTPAGYFLVKAKDFQIINGGQTTASLSNTRYKDKKDLEGIHVQMKLTVINEEDPDQSADLIQNISRSSNSQNKVSDADFFSTHPFHVRMEKFSRTIYAAPEYGSQHETMWFYERTRGQYLQEQMRMTPAQKRKFLAQNPKKKMITKTDLAKVRNSWDGFPHIVSKGAQANFLKFADIVHSAWEKNDLIFNKQYFKDSVALVILFRFLEELIPTQYWYQKGYRANIVTYTMALFHELIKAQFKGLDLDLQLIWKEQAIPECLVEPLKEIAEQVFLAITDEDRPTVNVTQWCKREACWKIIKDIEIELPDSLKKVLVGKDTKKALEKEAKADQKFESEVELQEEVVKHTSEDWKKLEKFVLDKQMTNSAERTALRIALKIPSRVPNGKQSKSLLNLLERASSEGFTF